jgi:hypothetical protein
MDGAAAASPPRIALLMVSMHPWAIKSRALTHEVVIDAWRAHVIAPLLADVPGTSLHTFLCMGSSLSAAEVAGLYANWSSSFDVAQVAGSAPFAAPESILELPDQFARMAACYQRAKQHEIRTASFFTHLIKARPDLMWVQRVPRLADLEPGRVSLRARALVNEPPQNVPFGALMGQRGCERSLFLTRTHTSSACGSLPLEPEGQRAGAERSAASALSHSSSCEHAAVGELRRHMRASSISSCAILDDQFAVVPRELGDGYFDIEGGGVGPHPNLAASLAYSQGYDPQAVRETYGMPTHPDHYLRTCPIVGEGSTYRAAGLELTEPLGWADTFLRGMNGRYTSVRQEATMQRDRAGACCEYRLTWRLTGRLVPVRVVPMYFIGAGTHGYLQHWTKAMAKGKNYTLTC